MTTPDLITQPIRVALHRADDAAVWWFHTAIHALTFVVALGVWHVQEQWHDTLIRDRVAIIGALTLVSVAVATLALT